jgi:hypothetical protein
MASTRLAFVRGALAHLAPEFDAPRPSRCQARLDPTSNEVALKLGQAGHDGPHQLAARGAEIEAEAPLSQDANFAAVEAVERLDELLRAATPSAENGDQDGIDFAGPSQGQDLGALGARIVGA